ncbi:MAG: DMT family transporter [Alphaproteobacteria bacterium]|nr:DMT family transporter [Alphaproteobacteria bacterium]
MIFKFIFPILAGISIVLQGTLNRHLATQIGLVSAVFLNALIFLIFSAILWLLVRYELVGGIHLLTARSIEGLKWWDFLPGIFGFLIVFSTPVAITFLGANLTFAVIICTQLAVSVAWDSLVNKQIPPMSTVLGVIVMLVGLVILSSGRK